MYEKIHKLKRFLLIKTGIILLLLFFLWPNKASALTISPPMREFGGDPGGTVQGIIKLYNETNTEIMVYPSAASFSAQEGGSGEPSFSDLDSAENGNDLANWIKIADGPFLVKPLDWFNTTFEINIPRDAEPGGHYAAIFFSPNKNEAERGEVSVDYRAGSLVLLTVSGDIKEAGKFKEFSLKDNKIFYEHLPVSMELKIENNGNVHFRPAGGVEIKNIFGKKTGEIPVIKTGTGGNVLPGSTRRYDLNWGDFSADSLPGNFWDKVKFEWKNFRFGKYIASATLGLPGGLSENRSVAFWIIPWQLILVIILALAVVVTLFKWYNRWIIKKAREGK